MCIIRISNHRRCGHAHQQTIIPCRRSDCRSNLSPDIGCDFHVQVTGIENAEIEDVCRECRREWLRIRDPSYYQINPEYLRGIEQDRLNMGYFHQQEISELLALQDFSRQYPQHDTQEVIAVLHNFNRLHPQHYAHMSIAATLPTVRIEDLAEADRFCPICIASYGKDRGLRPVRLGCCKSPLCQRCVIGLFDSGSYACPFCRFRFDRRPRP